PRWDTVAGGISGGTRSSTHKTLPWPACTLNLSAPSATSEVKEPVLPAQPEAIMTREEVAKWLKGKPRQVERLRIPCTALGPKTKRYFAKEVLVWLEAKRSARSSTSRRWNGIAPPSEWLLRVQHVRARGRHRIP